MVTTLCGFWHRKSIDVWVVTFCFVSWYTTPTAIERVLYCFTSSKPTRWVWLPDDVCWMPSSVINKRDSMHSDSFYGSVYASHSCFYYVRLSYSFTIFTQLYKWVRKLLWYRVGVSECKTIYFIDLFLMIHHSFYGFINTCDQTDKLGTRSSLKPF